MKVKPAKEPGRILVEVGRKDEKILTETSGAVGEKGSPFQLRKILVPLDFSDCSKKALQYAIPFAQHFNASIILLHVIQINFVGGEFGSIDFPLMETELRESRTKQLEAFARDEIRQRVPTETLLRTGQPVSEIVLAAKKLGVDLIIISTHGHTGLKHVFLGSTTENVVRYAPCPVLTVRDHEHEFITGLAGEQNA